MNKISELRKQIDSIDSEILKQLNKRIDLVLRISECKKRNSLPIEDLTREDEIISNLDIDNLDEDFVRDIYNVIFAYSKSIQR